MQTTNDNSINWKDFESFYLMINITILTVNKNRNNILSGEIIKYLISIQKYPKINNPKINKLNVLIDQNYKTIGNKFIKHSIE